MYISPRLLQQNCTQAPCIAMCLAECHLWLLQWIIMKSKRHSYSPKIKKKPWGVISMHLPADVLMTHLRIKGFYWCLIVNTNQNFWRVMWFYPNFELELSKQKFQRNYYHISFLTSIRAITQWAHHEVTAVSSFWELQTLGKLTASSQCELILRIHSEPTEHPQSEPTVGLFRWTVFEYGVSSHRHWVNSIKKANVLKKFKVELTNFSRNSSNHCQIILGTSAEN